MKKYSYLDEMWRIRSYTIQRITIYIVTVSFIIQPFAVSSNTDENYNDQTAIESERSPLYESNADLNTYHLLEDNHGYTTLQGHPDSPSSGKVRYILRKKTSQGNEKQRIYALQPYSNSRTQSDPYANRQFTIQNTSGPLAYYPTQAPPEPPQTQAPIPKKYAFAYAVRPGDGDNGDDFSHKETRDGKVTIGEYKVMLPDGRLQIVRYTADASNGFNADVTYEGEPQPYSFKPTNAPSSSPTPQSHSPPDYQENPPSGSPSPYTPYSQPQYQSTPSVTPSPYTPYSQPNYQNTPSATPSPYTPYQANPIFYNQQKSLKSYPSLSPSILYSEAGSQEHTNAVNNRAYDTHPHALIPISPTPPVTYNLNPPSSTIKKSQKSIQQQQQYINYKKPRSQPQYNNPKSTPNSIYDKIHSTSNIPYSPLPRGQRAGPAPSPQYSVFSTPSSPVYQQPDLYQERITKSTPQRRSKVLKLSPFDSSSYISSPNSKSRLVPIELFKAGPDRGSRPKKYKLVPADLHSHSSTEHDTLHPVSEHETHYIIHDGEDHPTLQFDEHHEIEEYHNNHHIPQSHLPPVKSSLATFTSSLGYKGNATPKPTLYIKSKPLIPVGRPIKPSVGGLVYLETPGQGPRPNSLGVKELLDRLPHDNLPRPKTTTHPYEIGRNDYGSNVGYTSNIDDIRSNLKSKKEFIPSQEIPPEYLPKTLSSTYKPPRAGSGSRDYLYDDNDEIVLYDNSTK